jgi:hypothetical protein
MKMEKVLKKIPKQSLFSNLAGKTIHANIFFTVNPALKAKLDEIPKKAIFT